MVLRNAGIHSAVQVLGVLVVLSIAILALWQGEVAQSSPPSFAISCANPRVIDGDTLDCGGHRIRLDAIDAPEMPGHCRKGRRCTPGYPFASRDRLKALTRGQVRCVALDTDYYGRTVARCDGREGDLSCAMVASGSAVQRYGTLRCG
ncbi:MAG: thermonuclease family protein [Alphaproteobacteria bacterium]|nr:thermonuclease family protein [Alphaproteobacteria bacterium]